MRTMDWRDRLHRDGLARGVRDRIELMLRMTAGHGDTCACLTCWQLVRLRDGRVG